MEDKTFELLEKLYNRMEEGFSEVKGDINRLEGSIARMENENAQKFGALFDGLTANTEAIKILQADVKALKKEVENHEIKLKLVK